MVEIDTSLEDQEMDLIDKLANGEIEKKEEESPILYIAGKTAKQIAKEYKASDIKKYAIYLGLDGVGKEATVAQSILDHLYA